MSEEQRARPAAGDQIEVRGAAQHNLQNINLVLPKRSLIVFTGVSGSGKSSLAFDTLYAEGQRRYVESLSAYARQFLGQMDKPVYDRISGLSPTIAIDQKSAGSNPRSTVGTITEILDHLRVLFARAGQQHCHSCGAPVGTQDPSRIVADVLALPEGTRILVLAPLARQRKGTFGEEFDRAVKLGFVRARVDGEVVELTPGMTLAKTRKHDVDLVVDRAVVRARDRLRLTDSIETALKEGEGRVTIAIVPAAPDPGAEPEPTPADRHFSEALYCDTCELSFPELSPARFSFNTPVGACAPCNGLGIALEVDPKRVVPNEELSVRGGAILPWARQVESNSWTARILEALERDYEVDLDTPWRDLSAADRKLLLYGADKRVQVKLDGKHGKGTWGMRYEGIIPQTARRWKETTSNRQRAFYAGFFAERTCSTCHGRRLRLESLSVRVGGSALDELCQLPIDQVIRWFEELKLEGTAAEIGRELIKEIRARLGFLLSVGLGYLTLDRGVQTLSGGESQRIRLASQVGSELSGVLYILDEPSIGLHPRDTGRLLKTLEHLRDLGNTVIVVEHDETTVRAADHMVDFGPGAGRHGGHIVASGTVAEVMASEASLTGAYLSGRRQIPLPSKRRKGRKGLRIRNASANNLQGIDVRIPAGCLTVVTGVSGAGKSSLVSGTILPAMAAALGSGRSAHPSEASLTGAEVFDKVIEVDQKPIGRTPRSNPATYAGVWGAIREVFANLPDSRVAGYAPARFSFNVKGGRCENCSGDGALKIEMHFLADVYVPCEVCGGRRFNEATLQVRYKGLSVADVLEATIDEAAELFRNHTGISRILNTLQRVGLGYLTLGQKAPTLSGGEAQRVKLAKELARPGTGKTLYVLDEPSTGLHFEDVARLLEVLAALVDRGNTVLVIEHAPDIIKMADHVIDLGPEGGSGGGHVVAMGTPEQIAACPESYTGVALRDLL